MEELDSENCCPPFLLKYGKGVQIDSIFSEVASNEPLAGLYIEGRLYRWNDLNADNDIQNDEMETVAIGSYTFPGTASGNFGTIRVGLEDLNTGDPFHTVTEDGRLYFAGITYQGGANCSMHTMRSMAKDNISTLKMVFRSWDFKTGHIFQ
ncbi:MAG: hypothetical protein IPL25_13250 [Saprospiraceae bacterium]|nr:hypothetical protein [Candidatus Vicinibacter affinis]